MKILVADPNLVAHRERLEAGLPDGAEACWATRTDAAALMDELRDADVFVGSRFTSAMADAAPQLRLVHVAGAGTDKIAFDSLRPGIQVCNTFHHEDSIAEYIAATAVLLRRNLMEQDRALRTGRWATSVYDPSISQPSSLQGARVGFVGFGHIGRSAWRQAVPPAGGQSVSPDQAPPVAGHAGPPLCLDRARRARHLLPLRDPLQLRPLRRQFASSARSRNWRCGRQARN
jgi:phosphoglycerate dehydrogenase-like enzyme